VISIRPKVASLAFHVFGRSVHPELFQIHRTRFIERTNYKARIDLTSDGHIVQFNNHKVTTTEIASTINQKLPQRRRILGKKIIGKRTDGFEGRQGVSYTTEYELETVGADLFQMVQKNLAAEQSEYDLLQIFDAQGRLGLGAVSFIHVESRSKSLTVQCLHTFPDDEAIIKSFSTFSVE
jgi:hypothetical protein